MKLKLLLFLLIAFLTLTQIPAYYSPVNFNTTGDNIMIQLSHLITTTHTTNLPYTLSTLPDRWVALKTTDLEVNGSNNVLLIYGWNDTDTDFTNDITRQKDLSIR